MDKQQLSYCALRRDWLAHEIGEHAVMVISGATEHARNRDNMFPFRQESGFHYLTGWDHPDATLVIEGGTGRSHLFYETHEGVKALFEGRLPTYRATQKIHGFTTAGPPEKREALLKKLLTKNVRLYCAASDLGEIPAIQEALAHNREITWSNLSIIDEMRLVKDAGEISTMRSAANISAQTHHDILSVVTPGMREYELAAEISYRFARRGGDPLHAYPSIVASGANACTLHYTKHDSIIQDGDLVLVDAGCELDGYASDITRTFPANGKWSPEQRTIYDIVLKAQTCAIMVAAKGSTLSMVHRVAELVLAQGLIEQGILKDSCPEDAVDRTMSLKRFYPHGTSHWLGRDVHDVGNYEFDEHHVSQRKLEPGMVFTIEPGLYFPPHCHSVESKWRGIGIRIEDDILITSHGNEVLSQGAPKDPDEITAIMHASRK